MLWARGLADPVQSPLTGRRAKLWSVPDMPLSKRTLRALFTMLWLVTSLGAWMDYASAHSAPAPVGASHHENHHGGEANIHEAVERLIGAVEDSRPDLGDALSSAPDLSVHLNALPPSAELGLAERLASPVPPFQTDPNRSSQSLRDLATVRLLI